MKTMVRQAVCSQYTEVCGEAEIPLWPRKDLTGSGRCPKIAVTPWEYHGSKEVRHSEQDL